MTNELSAGVEIEPTAHTFVAELADIESTRQAPAKSGGSLAATNFVPVHRQTAGSS
jgi:hypothetical protein